MNQYREIFSSRLEIYERKLSIYTWSTPFSIFSLLWFNPWPKTSIFHSFLLVDLILVFYVSLIRNIAHMNFSLLSTFVLFKVRKECRPSEEWHHPAKKGTTWDTHFKSDSIHLFTSSPAGCSGFYGFSWLVNSSPPSISQPNHNSQG